MPMIDVYAPAGLLPAADVPDLLQRLAGAVLRHEGGDRLRSPYLENTVAFLHELPAGSVATGAGAESRLIRVQVVTPPGALDREGQKGLVGELTSTLADAAGDPALARRIFVILGEAAEGGWGVAGTAFGRAEFAAAASRSPAVRQA